MNKKIELNLSEAKEVLLDLFQTSQNVSGIIPMLWGAPGIGKTGIVVEIAKELNAIVVPLFSSLQDETEISGVPVADNKEKQIKYYLKENNPINLAKKNQNQIYIWFWDEINRGRIEVLQALFSIISNTPRNIDGVEIPDNVYIVGAGNLGEEDGTIVIEVDDKSFNNKLTHFYIKFDKKTFINYLKNKYSNKNEVVNIVINFLETMNEKYCYNIPVEDSEERAYPTPRSIEKFIKYISKYNTEDLKNSKKLRFIEIIGSGLVGMNWTKDFLSYLKETIAKDKEDNVSIIDLILSDDKNKTEKVKRMISKIENNKNANSDMEKNGVLNDLIHKINSYDESLVKNLKKDQLELIGEVLKLVENIKSEDIKKGIIDKILANEKMIELIDRISIINKEVTDLFINELQ